MQDAKEERKGKVPVMTKAPLANLVTFTLLGETVSVVASAEVAIPKLGNVSSLKKL
jgi:hypothetical protein